MYPLTNAYKAQLTNLPYAAGATEIEVNHVTDLPDPATDGEFNLVIWNRSHGDPADAKLQNEFEIVKVTGIAGTTLTVERGQESTAALELAAGGNWQCVLAATTILFEGINNLIGAKVSTSDIINNLTSEDENKPLSALQGKVLQDGKEPADDQILKEGDVEDSLNSTSVNKPLSANQGKQLNDNKASLSFLLDVFGRRDNLLFGRTKLNATDLVTLDFGDDKSKDNTTALQELMDRPTAQEELIVFPEGVLYSDNIEIKEGIAWIGEGRKTQIKWRDQTLSDGSGSVISSNSTSNWYLGQLLFDGRRGEHDITTPPTKSVEGVEIDDGSENYVMESVIVINAEHDAFDMDDCGNGLFINCIAEKMGFDGFHNSTGSFDNIFINCFANECVRSGGRGGFTVSENSLGGHKFINCTGKDNSSRNFSIREDQNGKTTSLINCQSIGGRKDETEGVLIGGLTVLPGKPIEDGALKYYYSGDTLTIYGSVSFVYDTGARLRGAFDFPVGFDGNPDMIQFTVNGHNSSVPRDEIANFDRSSLGPNNANYFLWRTGAGSSSFSSGDSANVFVLIKGKA